MGENTAIGWTHHTFNPWTGCVEVSPGCANCYAKAWDRRMGGGHWGPVAPRQQRVEAYWRQPLAWARKARKAGERHRVFCGSMCDWAEDREDLQAPRARLFKLILETQDDLDWLLLSKRIDDAARMLPWAIDADRWAAPWPGVWVGTTVEDRRRALERIPVLARIPAAVRFLSMEPLLEEVSPAEAAKLTTGRPMRECVDWVIGGCESGDGKRPASASWFRRLRDECAPEGVPFFLKQAEPETGTATYPSGRAAKPIIIGSGNLSKYKRDGVIEAPYLDGRQHLEYPTPRAVA